MRIRLPLGNLTALARLWDGIGGFDNVGFCLDTCRPRSS